MRQASKGTSKIVGSNLYAQVNAVPGNHFIYSLCANCVTMNAAHLVNGTKYRSRVDPGSAEPLIDNLFRPSGHWHRANAAVFATNIDQDPPAGSVLHHFNCDGGHFTTPKTT